MRRIVLLSLLLVSLEFASAQKYVITDPKAEKREVGSFSGVKVSSAISLYVSQSDETALAVSVPEETMRPSLKTEVKKGVLHVWFDSNEWKKNSGWKSWKSGSKIKVYVTGKNINMLEAAGASDISVLGKYNVSNLSVTLSGASDITGELVCEELNMDLSGASDAKIKGNVKNLSTKLSGASSIKGYGLQIDNCDIDASGASLAEITVDKEIVVSASGASDIKIKGAGVIKDMRSNGASTIKKVEK